MKGRLSTWLYITLLFLSGGVLGAFVDRLYTANVVTATTKASPEVYRRKYMDEMRARLALTPAQVKDLGVILDETRGKMHQLHEQYRPAMTAIHNDQVARVRAILTGDQQKEYEKMRIEREKREGKDRK